MGTPAFAVPSLEILLQHGYPVVGVVTAPDKPAGRGLKLQQSEIKDYAQSKGLNVLQPAKLKDPLFGDDLRALHADLQVVVAFRMLPESVWSMPPLGTVNLHASLLPQYRGAAPINWAIINGDKETGLTTFRLLHQIDTGNILFTEKMQIGARETAGQLHDRMMQVGAGLLLKTVDALDAGKYLEVPQENIPVPGIPKTAPKLNRENGHIHWEEPVERIFNQIRGLSPYPGAWTLLHEKTIKIFAARKESAIGLPPPGTLSTDHQSFLKFAAEDGWITVDELQMEGKKKMNIAEFLRGYRGR